MPDLQKMCRFRVDAEALAALNFPEFSGSMLRGALGHALAYLNNDIYLQLFETGAGHAFVVTPPVAQMLDANQPFHFYITLFKNDESTVELFFQALQLAFYKGLGSSFVPCKLVQVTTVPFELQPLPQEFLLYLTSPWVVKYRNQSLAAEDVEFSHLLIAAAKRQRELVKRGYLEVKISDNEQLLECLEHVQVSSELYNVSGERFSNRQHAKHPLFGVRGVLHVKIQNEQALAMIAPILNRAQWLHAGGKVSFGLGALEIVPMARPNSQLQQLQQLATGVSL